MSRDCLSEHDRNVLDSIFNPFQTGGENLLNYVENEENEEIDDKDDGK